MSDPPRDSIPLTDAVLMRLKNLFEEPQRAEAAHLLEHECGNNLPFCEESTAEQLDRLRFAAMKLSGGSLEELIEAIVLAQTDWRDLLMTAGFGEDVSAHLDWMPAPQ